MRSGVLAVEHVTGLDHLLAVDRAAPVGLRRQLEDQLRAGIRAGTLHPGAALPATRTLARDLGVARGVVVEAYAQLVAEGFLVARPGSGTRVAEALPASGGRARAVAPPSPREAGDGSPRVRFDFRVEAGDLAAFPRRAWLHATRRALAAAPDAALGYGDRAGVPALREALASYLGRSRGVVADADGVVVTAGATQAVALLGAVLRRRGVRRVAVEQPGFFLHHGLLRRLGLQVVGVPVDAGGLRVELLGAGVGAVLVTPAHQHPTGAALAPERRTALLAWAQEHDALVIEDDYDAEFRYDRAPVGALQGLAPGHVALVGSVSKTLAPAVRLGWLVPPAHLLADVAAEKAWADGGCPALPQLVLAELIAGGDLDRHLRRQRPLLRRRRDALLETLAAELPEAEVGGVAAGLHVMAFLPGVPDPAAFFAAQWAQGVAVYGDGADGGVRVLLGWANCPQAAIAPGVCAFARIARGFLAGAAQPSPA